MTGTEVRRHRRERFCWVCGESLGLLTRAEWQPFDTCGKTACNREAQAREREFAREAHEQLDHDLRYR